MNTNNQDLKNSIRDAQALHRHLGTFLVIGVRICILAQKRLNLDTTERNKMLITARLPLSTPFSCILDGIQSTTQCTVGNRKLEIEKSTEKISVHFQRLNSSRKVMIYVRSREVDQLKDGLSQGFSNEELAKEVAAMPKTIYSSWRRDNI